MKTFMNEDFLLENGMARMLYRRFAQKQPIFDFHCHLSPQEIDENKTFYNLTQLWLAGDHYKWRLMRIAGIDERLITGDAPDREKFLAFAACLPHFAGNPVYQWAHLELQKYFGIHTPIGPETAGEIWDQTLAQMADGHFCARKLIRSSGVETVITTDDPADDLHFHRSLKEQNTGFSVRPCFRADNVIHLENAGFREYLTRLGHAAGLEIRDLDSLKRAVEKRLDFFVQNGAVAADMSVTDFPGKGTPGQAERALGKALAGAAAEPEEIAAYQFELLSFIGAALTRRGMVWQLHCGVLRNLNPTLYGRVGADCGCDSVGNVIDIEHAAALLASVEQSGGLPRTMVYTLNPGAYYPIATLLGDFAGKTPGRLQLGAAWWFLDHADGIREQLRLTSLTGSLGYFNGMLTDSRSFVSYARHDYFRRVLCSVIGAWVEQGLYPNDPARLGRLVENICYRNARSYFQLEDREVQS